MASLRVRPRCSVTTAAADCNCERALLHKSSTRLLATPRVSVAGSRRKAGHERIRSPLVRVSAGLGSTASPGDANAAAAAPVETPQRQQFYEWKPGKRVAYRVVPSSSPGGGKSEPPILLLTGFGVGNFHYDRLLRQLEGISSDVYLLDWFGQGKSPRATIACRVSPKIFMSPSFPFSRNGAFPTLNPLCLHCRGLVADGRPLPIPRRFIIPSWLRARIWSRACRRGVRGLQFQRGHVDRAGRVLPRGGRRSPSGPVWKLPRRLHCCKPRGSAPGPRRGARSAQRHALLGPDIHRHLGRCLPAPEALQASPATSLIPPQGS